jgi:6-pyruvoyltetrahydropterin/6-carboxytetrahydropterin synthase
VREVRLTKRIEFAAAHRFWRQDWDEARNRAVFRKCANEHGHNYLLEVTVAGVVDEQTGMVVNLYDLKRVLKEVLEEFDHKHLNRDTPYFANALPTTEHVAGLLWKILDRRRPEIGRLEKIRLYEEEDGCAELSPRDVRSDQPWPISASVMRRYRFPIGGQPGTTAKRNMGPLLVGGDTQLDVTIRGALRRDTGMVVDPDELDRVVHAEILDRLPFGDSEADGKIGQTANGEALVQALWTILEKAIPAGDLERIVLSCGPDLSYELNGRG